MVGEAYYNLKQWSLAKEYYTKTLKLGNATTCYGFNQRTVENRIESIDKLLVIQDRLKSNISDNKIGNNENEQEQFYNNCLDAAFGCNDEASIYLLIFAMKQFGLSSRLFVDVLKQTENDKLDNWRHTMVNMMNQMIDTIRETERSTKTDQHMYEWKYSIVKHLIGTEVNDSKCDEDDHKKESVLLTKEPSKELEINGDWQNDLDKLSQVSKKGINEIDLEEYCKISKLAANQKDRLRTKFYAKMSSMNQNLFSCQVCTLFWCFIVSRLLIL